MNDEMTKFDGNGADEATTARAKVEEMRGGEGNAITNVVQSELGLLKMIISAAAMDKLQDHLFWRMSSFLDENEALDHVAAYWEAKDLGMDTAFNLDYIFALCSANRKIGRTNLTAAILDSISSFRYTSNQPKDDKKGTGVRSTGPLS